MTTADLYADRESELESDDSGESVWVPSIAPGRRSSTSQIQDFGDSDALGSDLISEFSGETTDDATAGAVNRSESPSQDGVSFNRLLAGALGVPERAGKNPQTGPGEDSEQQSGRGPTTRGVPGGAATPGVAAKASSSESGTAMLGGKSVAAPGAETPTAIASPTLASPPTPGLRTANASTGRVAQPAAQNAALERAGADMRTGAAAFSAATAASAAAQISRVRTAGQQQKQAVTSAIGALRSEITASFAQLRTRITGDGQAAKQRLATDRDAQKQRIDTSLQAQITRIRESVPQQRQEILELGAQLSADAIAHGGSESRRVASETRGIAAAARNVGTQKAAAHADKEEASDIAEMARGMANEAARSIVENGLQVTQACLTDGRALGAKLREDAAGFAENLSVDDDSIAQIRDAATQSKSDLDNSYTEVSAQIDEAVQQALGSATSGQAAALAQIAGMQAPMLQGIDAAVQSAVSAIEAGETQANSEMEGAVNTVFSSLAGVDESQAQQGVSVMMGLTAQLEAGQQSATSGIAQLGDASVQGIQEAGQTSVATISASGAEITGQNTTMGDGIAAQLGEINTSAAAGFAQMATEAETVFSDTAAAVIDTMGNAYTEARDSLNATYQDGTREITGKVDTCVSEMNGALSTLGASIDRKADEMENASWWEGIASAVSGFVRGFVGALLTFLRDLLVVLAIALVVLVILVVVIVVLVAIFPALLGPLLAGALFLAVHGALILTIVGYIGLALGVAVFAAAVYNAWEVWQDPSTTWSQKWEAIGNATFQLVDVIGPGKFVQWAQRLRGGARALDGLHEVARVDDVANAGTNLSRADDVANAGRDLSRIDEVADAGADLSRADDVAGAGADLSRADDIADASTDLSRADDVADVSTDLSRADEVADVSTDLSRADDVADVSARNPLYITADELRANPEAGERLFAMADFALSNVAPRLQNITQHIPGGELVVGLKRASSAEFVGQVLEKVTRKGYSTVGEMTDMARGRINVERGEDIADAVHRIVEEFPGARVDWKEGLSYPRAHLEIDAPNAIVFELQVGTHATSRFLETADVMLPDPFMRAMGRSDPAIDFHDVMYKGIARFDDVEIRQNYQLDDLLSRYDEGMSASGTGHFDAEGYTGLRADIQRAIDELAANETEAIRRVFGVDD